MIKAQSSQKMRLLTLICQIERLRPAVLAGLLIVVISISPDLARAQTEKLRLGALPILPSAQAFLLAQDESASEFDILSFARDGDIVQALVEGKIDIAYADPAAVLRQRDQGDLIEVIASASVDAAALILRGDLAETVTPDLVAEGLNRAAQQEGASLSIVGLVGSGSTAALRAWMNRSTKLDYRTIRLQRGRLGAVWRSLLREKIQAAILPEPALTHILETDLTARIVLRSREILAGLPASIVAVRQHSVGQDRARLIDFLHHHIAATLQLQDKPEKAAKRLVPMIGYGDLPASLIERALRSPATYFATDPEAMARGMEDLQAILMNQGRIRGHFTLYDLINTTLYQEASLS